jgi:hypothetical protein
LKCSRGLRCSEVVSITSITSITLSPLFATHHSSHSYAIEALLCFHHFCTLRISEAGKPATNQNQITGQMKLKFYTALLLIAVSATTYAQEQMNLKVYNMTNTPIFTSNEFKGLGIGKHGHVWAGSWNTGVYIFNGKTWRKSTMLTNHDINDIKADKFGNIWIAQSGRNGGQTIGGGINFFPDTLAHDEIYSRTEGLPNRNPKSLYINNRAADNVAARYRVWSAHMSDVTAGTTSPGGIGHGYLNLPFSNKPFYSITDSIQVSNYGNVNCIAGNSDEIWVSVTENFNKSEILVYSITFDTYFRKYSSTNSQLPAGFNGRAMHFDKLGRCWFGTQLNGIYVFTGGAWQKIDVPSVIPANIIINQNAITSDREGNIYIGTNQGLIMYTGGSIQDAASYKRYTTANGLPSNYVRSIAIDTMGTNPYYRVLATDNGMVFWNPDSVIVESYHIYNNDVNNRYKVGYRSIENIKVAADSSSATVFKVLLANANQCIVRIKEDPTSAAPKQYGYLMSTDRYNDSLVVRYHHASYPNIPINQFSREMKLEIVDTVLNRVKYEKTIEIVRPPIVFVHGLFSNGNDAFGNFKAKLIADGMYKQEQIMLVNYPADQGYVWTTPKLAADKNALLRNALMVEKILCSKADVAGHSMGGLLLRRYMQGDSYKGDINKYFSINTPHSGSPVPNFVLHNEWTKDVVRNVMGYNPDAGALKDLRLNSAEIDSNINNLNLNRVKVPSHLIITTMNFSSVDQLTGMNLSNTTSPTLLLVLALANSGLDYLNNTLYAGVAHDGAVSEVSQKAGLAPTYWTYVPDQHHSSTGEPHPAVYAKFTELVSADPDDSGLFTRNGFNPPNIDAPAGLERRTQLTNTGTLDITSPAMGTTTTAGTAVTLNFNYTNVDTIIAVMGSKSNKLYTASIAKPATTFTFNVPAEYIGNTKIYLLGFNGNGYVTKDSVDIVVNTTATLDSIATDPRTLQVPQKHFNTFNTVGYYNDQKARNLTGITGAVYTFKTNNASYTAPGTINGINKGVDTLVITYGGKTTLLPIEITDSTNWADEKVDVILPLQPGQLTASLKNNSAALQWTAYDDRDILKYDVEHSSNGITFKTVDAVASKQSALLHNYNFVHTTIAEGRNFYRVKLTDLNGHSAYTNIASITTAGKQSMVVKPNPVTTTVHLQLVATKDEIATIRIIDAGGKLVRTETCKVVKGQNMITFSAVSFTPGAYMIEAILSTGKTSTSLIKL